MKVTCPKCNGSRINLAQVGTGVGAYVNTSSCTQCDGSGLIENGRIYFVLWFNRKQFRLEMHDAHCVHQLITKPEEFENLSAHWTNDLRESMREIAKDGKAYGVLIEDCLL